MIIYPRHLKILKFLHNSPGKLMSIEDISQGSGIAYNTVRNEMPALSKDNDNICTSTKLSSVNGRPVRFYSWGQPTLQKPNQGKTSSIDAIALATPKIVQQLHSALNDPDYTPTIIELAWNSQTSINLLYAISQGLEPLSKVQEAKKLMTQLLEAHERAVTSLTTLLSTEALWQDPSKFFPNQLDSSSPDEVD